MKKQIFTRDITPLVVDDNDDPTWLADVTEYELRIRNETAKALCNRAEIETMRYVLRVTIEKLKQKNAELARSEREADEIFNMLARA